MKQSGNIIVINNDLEKPLELWHIELLPHNEEKRTKIGIVTNITSYYHVLVQIKKKKLSGYYFKSPDGKSTVMISPNGKASDNPDWLFGKFDEYLMELID